MTSESTASPSIDVVEGASAVLVGGGILTFALFPLALPLIALTVVATLPLVLIAVAVGLLAAILAAPILLLRGLRNAVRDERRRRRARPVPTPAAGTRARSRAPSHGRPATSPSGR
jgi:hypothetical protein